MDEEPPQKRQKWDEPSTSGAQQQDDDNINEEEPSSQSLDSSKQNDSDDETSVELKASDCYVIETHQKQERKKFKTEVVDHVVRFNRERLDQYIANRDNIMAVLHDMFDSLIENLMTGFEPNDRVSIELHVPGSDRPIWVPMMRRADIDAEKILKAIQQVQQSNSSLQLELLEIHILRIKMPSGSGFNDSEDGAARLTNMKSILQIKNKDSLCLPRALVTARAFIEVKDRDKSKWDKIRKDSKDKQKRLAIKLCQQANVGQGPFDLEDVSKFQDVLPDYQILVTELQADSNDKFLYKGPLYKEEKLCLLYHEHHFHVINTMKGFLNSGYFCGFCLKGFSTFEHHRCNNICLGCFNNIDGGCHPEGETLKCSRCNRFFQSKSCFERHEKTPLAMGNKTKKTICDRIRRCDKCNRTIKDQHECGKAYCHTCQRKQPISHQCYMQVLEECKDEFEVRKQIYIFFDIECRQDHEVKDGTYLHIPNYCIAQRVCGLCIKDNNFEAGCENCKKGEFPFRGDSTVKEFCQWLLSDENWGAIAIAHNMKGYDGHFIIRYLENTVGSPRVIKKGSKIMLIEITDNKKPTHMRHRKGKKLKVIDSFNFIPIALSAFPNTFGITETKKGYFPHLFNTKVHENYVGNWPEKEYYSPKEMKKDQADDFEKWYDKQEGKIFNMSKEILEYCKSDVDILRRGCAEFRTLFLEATGQLDPFEKSITIAAACMRVFRKSFLKKDTIAVVPHDCYRKKVQQSKMAMQWMKWRESTDNVDITYVGHGGEESVGKYKVDGLCKTQRKVYEFNGCIWHGCPKCYPDDRSRKLLKNGKTIHELYQQYLHRKSYIVNAGYDLEEIWECDFKKNLRRNPDMKRYVDQLTIHEPLNPRDAFYGGRNNAIKLHHVARPNEGETVKYIDICSLYPWVNKYGKYPVGHPEILTEDLQTNIEQYEGFVKCTILPPEELFHPVLPYRCGPRGKEKLLFPLCASCAENRQSSCGHDEKERALYGTWVTDELKKAVAMGYKVLEVHEAWHFKETKKYDPESNENGLFTEYVNTFLKLKQEADGWPSHCKSEKQKTDFVLEYRKRGIELEASKISRNKGKRTLAKLMLNSFWGKFGQRSDLSRTDYVQTKDDYFKFLHDETKVINNVSFTSDGEKAIIHWTDKDDHVETMPNTNIFIAAYTTAMARLKLYTYLEKLKDRVLYFDTDSVIYISKKGEYDPPTGDFLGDMTDELSKDYGEGSYITEFVSGGPKNYGYQVYSTAQKDIIQVCKIKGFTLNIGASQHINFSAMRGILENVTGKMENDPLNSENFDLSEETITSSVSHIKRTKQGKIVTEHATKVYRMVYDKRVLNYNDFTTLPFGFKSCPM